MKKIFVSIFFIVFIILNNEIFSQQLSLKDVIDLTIKNHPLIQQKEDDLRAANFRIDQQKSFYLPNIKADATYTRIGPIPSFNFGGESLDLAPANNYNIGLFVHQTLYDFGKRDAQVQYAESFLNSIRDSKDLIKNELSNQAIKVFYSILFLKNSIAVKDTQYAALQEHLTITDLKIKNGTATDYDALSTKTKLAEIKNEKYSLLNEKNKQEYYLKELVGYDRNKEISINGQFDLPDVNINPDSLINSAFNQRLELKVAYDAINTGNLQKEIIKQSDKPVLNADLGYGFKNGYEPNINVLRGNWFAGVSVEVPIFNGNLTENRINEASANIDASDKKVEQIKNSISTEIYQAISDLKNSLEKIKLTEDQMNYARKSLERAKIQYEKGAGTNLEVLDAETTLTQAKLLNIQAAYRAVINFYTLKQAVGEKIFENLH